MNSLPFSTCEGQAWEMSRHSEFADWLHLLYIKFGFGSENTRGEKKKVLLSVFTNCRALSCRELSVSSPSGVEGTCWCSAISGDLRRAHSLFLLSHKNLRLHCKILTLTLQRHIKY